MAQKIVHTHFVLQKFRVVRCVFFNSCFFQRQLMKVKLGCLWPQEKKTAAAVTDKKKTCFYCLIVWVRNPGEYLGSNLLSQILFYLRRLWHRSWWHSAVGNVRRLRSNVVSATKVFPNLSLRRRYFFNVAESRLIYLKVSESTIIFLRLTESTLLILIVVTRT